MHLHQKKIKKDNNGNHLNQFKSSKKEKVFENVCNKEPCFYPEHLRQLSSFFFFFAGYHESVLGPPLVVPCNLQCTEIKSQTMLAPSQLFTVNYKTPPFVYWKKWGGGRCLSSPNHKSSLV